MTYSKNISLLLTLFLFSSLFYQHSALAKDPYLYNGSIGSQSNKLKSNPTPPKADFLYTKPIYWKGLEVVFLPPNKTNECKNIYYYAFKSLSDTEEPYKDDSNKDATNNMVVPGLDPENETSFSCDDNSSSLFSPFSNEAKPSEKEYPKYSDLAGKTATVTDIKNIDYQKKLLIFKINSTNQYYTAEIVGDEDQIPGIVLKRDIDKARLLFLNKTLYSKQTELYTYNAASNKAGSITIKKFSPLQVINIVLGTDTDYPIRFILKTANGKLGYYDLNLSGSNRYEPYRDNNSSLSSYFFKNNPRITYKWPEYIWQYLENGEIILGMNEQQVKMVWGEPEDINTSTGSYGTHEQWVYGDNSYLYFENGRLTSIQD